MPGGTADDSAADLVIRDVVILDGHGAPGRPGSVVVRDGRIHEVRHGDRGYDRGRRVLDGAGSVCAPGFVDAHVHTDVDLLWDRQHAASLCQGVTTHVIGQDGLSYAPLSPHNLEQFKRYGAAANGLPDITWDWSSVAEYRRRFHGVAANTAYLVPHGTVRFEVSGMSADVLRGAALDAARGLVDRALAEGAVGFSTGLSYYPGSYADTDELVALSEVAAAYGRPYVTHYRTVFPHGYVDPIDEAVEISRRSGAKLHISHYRPTAATVGRVDQVMAKLDEAYADGVDITFDMYPYVYGSGPLYIALPPWAFDGGLDRTLDRLADASKRQALVAGIHANAFQVQGILTHAPAHPEYLGRDIHELAAEQGRDVGDVVCDLLLDDQLDVMFHLGTRELVEDRALNDQFDQDCLAMLDRPYAMVGSDGVYVGASPHPRGFGTFPRLVRLAREHGYPLERLVNRMTKVAADRFGLDGRGVIEPGAPADLVVFDPQRTTDRATPEWPRRAPAGIQTVVVNGAVAVDDGRPTGLLAGRPLP